MRYCLYNGTTSPHTRGLVTLNYGCFKKLVLSEMYVNNLAQLHKVSFFLSLFFFFKQTIMYKVRFFTIVERILKIIIVH